MKQLTLIIGALVVLAGCIKEEPQDLVVLAPSFEVAGTLNGAPFDFTPGGNGRYMFTESRALSGGRAVFEAEIAHLNGENDESLSFIIHFDNAAGESLVDRFTSLDLGEQALVLESFDLAMEFSTLDGSEIQYSQGGDLEVASSFTLSLNELVGPLFIGGNGPSCFANSIFVQVFPFIGCDPSFEWGNVVKSEEEEGFVTLTPPPFTAQYDVVNWVVNGETISQPGGVGVVVENDPDNGLSVELYTDEVFGGTTPFLIQQFLPFFEDECELPLLQGVLTGSYVPVVEVRYTSPQGARYRSLLACNGPSQPADAHFTIGAFDDYLPNEAGKATRSVHFSTELVLYPVGPNPGLEPIDLVLTNSRIAFAVEE